MKKLIALLLVLVTVLSFAACGKEPAKNDGTTPSDTTGTTASDATTGKTDDSVMNYEAYKAAAMDSKVTVETYVQATQSWWDNKITAYCQSKDGAYFAYELACTEEDAAKLVPGTKIKITGTKGEWSGEIEIMDGTFEIVEGGDTFIAEALDVTDLLAKDELIDHQNKKVAFKDMKVKKIEYKNGEPGDDIYVTLDKDGAEYSFCVEIYLTGKDTDVYKTVGELKAGDVVDVEGFLYWYEGANPHITAITKK